MLSPLRAVLLLGSSSPPAGRAIAPLWFRQRAATATTPRLGCPPPGPRRRQPSGAAAPMATAAAGAAEAADAPAAFRFGPWPIKADQVFYRTDLSFAFVNLKPLVPGHVLVSPIQQRVRFADLTPEEVADMWQAAQRVGAALERHHGACALTLAIQDGAAAGQTVPHVHVHVLPRRGGDFARNDDVYPAIEAQEEAMDGLHKQKEENQRLDLDIERKPRTDEEMAAEAAVYRALFD